MKIVLSALSFLWVIAASGAGAATGTINLGSVYGYSCDLTYTASGKVRHERHFIGKPYDKTPETQEKLRQDLAAMRLRFDANLNYRSLDIMGANQLPYRDQGQELMAYFLSDAESLAARQETLDEIRSLVMKNSGGGLSAEEFAQWKIKQGEVIEKNFLLAKSSVAVKVVSKSGDSRRVAYFLHFNAQKALFAISVFPAGALPVVCDRVNQDLGLNVKFNVEQPQ